MDPQRRGQHGVGAIRRHRGFPGHHSRVTIRHRGLWDRWVGAGTGSSPSTTKILSKLAAYFSDHLTHFSSFMTQLAKDSVGQGNLINLDGEESVAIGVGGVRCSLRELLRARASPSPLAFSPPLGGGRSGSGVGLPGKPVAADQAVERIGAELWMASAQLGKNVDQARRESSEFFRVTLIFAGLGLALILIGIVLFLLRQTTAGAVSAIAATIAEATAALFFKKDRELRETIRTYHQQMLESQRLLLMIEVANTMEVQGDRDRMKRSIIYRALNSTSINAESKT